MSYSNCKLCPRNCGINREKYKGICGADDKIKVALVSIHEYEEPVVEMVQELYFFLIVI